MYTENKKLNRLEIEQLLYTIESVDIKMFRTTVEAMFCLSLIRLVSKLKKKLQTQGKKMTIPIAWEEYMALSYLGKIIDFTPVLMEQDPEIIPGNGVLSKLILEIPSELIKILGPKNKSF